MQSRRAPLLKLAALILTVWAAGAVAVGQDSAQEPPPTSKDQLIINSPYGPREHWRGSDPGVYDNFNSKWIDPSKWETHPNCWSGPPLECVCEIQNGKLRLLVRTIGATDSDSGGQDSSSFLAFANPNAIRSITTTATVRAADGGTCATNSYIGTAKATVGGTFFNVGTGNGADDAYGVIVLSSYASSGSNTLDVGGWVGGGNGLNIWTHMGNYPKGKPISVTVAWDQPNHQYVFTVRPDGGAANQVSVPYNLPDTQPPSRLPWMCNSHARQGRRARRLRWTPCLRPRATLEVAALSPV